MRNLKAIQPVETAPLSDSGRQRQEIDRDGKKTPTSWGSFLVQLSSLKGAQAALGLV